MSLLAARALRGVAVNLRAAPGRLLHTGAAGGKYSGGRAFAAAVGIATGAAGSYAAYTHFTRRPEVQGTWAVPVAMAAGTSYPPSQASVFSPTKEHALYLWIHLDPNADVKKCAKIVADIQAHVDAVCPPDDRTENTEILAGVGFGHLLYAKIGPSAPRKKYEYRERQGALGGMPALGGDIFVHAKSDNVSMLFELAQRIMGQLPEGSVSKFEDVYSFLYRNGRDLTGFIDGTENPADEDDRREVAVEPETGGSYVITQKWIHKMDAIAKEKTANLEKFVGRTREDSIELDNKPVNSHVARMTGGTAKNQKKPVQIVRQSMPYGNLHDKAGLFFIGYAASPQNFDYMLDRMVGLDKDKQSDDIMRVTQCVASTYWYFPSVAELKKIKGGGFF